MSRGTKTLIWILVLAAVLAAFVWQGRQRLRQEEALSIEDVQREQGVPVDVVTAPVAVLEDWRRFTGAAEGWRQVDLVNDFRTKVESLHAGLGDDVEAGALIVSLDPHDPARLAMNLEAAAAQYESARADSQRVEALYAKGAVSRQQLEHTRTAVTAARVQWLSAGKAVELRTPVAGVVTALRAEEDRYAEAGEVVATVSSYDRLRVRLELSEAERSSVEEGAPARIVLEGGGELSGRVHRVALSADSETRLYPAELSFENPGHVLRPGALVSAELRVARSEPLPLLPATALVRRDGETYCWVLEGDGPLARRRRIEVGVRNGELLAVRSGLAEGERVVLAGQSRLEDGARVRVRADLSAEAYGSLN